MEDFKANYQRLRDRSAESGVEMFLEEVLKKEINNLLYTFLPSSTTLREMEDLAVALFVTIEDRWNLERAKA